MYTRIRPAGQPRNPKNASNTTGCPAFLTPAYKRPELKALPENLDDYDTIFLTGTPELLTRYAEMVPPVDEPK